MQCDDSFLIICGLPSDQLVSVETCHRKKRHKMNRQKLHQFLLSFSAAVSVVFVFCLVSLWSQSGSEWDEFQARLRSLAALGQVVNAIEFKDLMDFLSSIRDGQVLMSKDFMLFLILINLVVACVCIWFAYRNIRGAGATFKPVDIGGGTAVDPALVTLDRPVRTSDNENYKTFVKALDDMKSATEALAKIVGKGTLAEIQGDLERCEVQYNKVIHVAAAGNLICNEIQGVHKALSKTSKRLQRLAHQCRDSANFSATTQLDWKRNIMINNLRQVRESQDKVYDTASHIRSVHQSSVRLLQEIFNVETIFQERCTSTTDYLSQVQEASKPGFREIDLMVTRISEAKDQADQAGNLVSGLTQRAEAIVNMIHMIDDLAEQINLQALNASIEAAKMGPQGGHFAEIAERLCKLTSRSSVTSQSISELLTTIQEETGRAGAQLSGTCEAMESAFLTVSECGNTYRKAVSTTKYALSEISLLSSEFAIHMNKLREIKKLGLTTSELFERLSSLLEADDKMSGRINDETSRLTAYSDKLAHLLAKQFHELNHCEKMLLDTTNLVLELEKQATENKHATLSLKVALEQLDSSEGAIALDDFSQRIANRHLTLLKSSTEALEHFRLGQTADSG